MQQIKINGKNFCTENNLQNYNLETACVNETKRSLKGKNKKLFFTGATHAYKLTDYANVLK